MRISKSEMSQSNIHIASVSLGAVD